MFDKNSGLIANYTHKINRWKVIFFLPFFLFSTFTRNFFIRHINDNAPKVVYKSNLKKAKIKLINIIAHKGKTTPARQNNVIPLIKATSFLFTSVNLASTLAKTDLPVIAEQRYYKTDPVFLRTLRI